MFTFHRCSSLKAASPKHFEETVRNVPVTALQLTGAAHFHMHDRATDALLFMSNPARRVEVVAKQLADAHRL